MFQNLKSFLQRRTGHLPSFFVPTLGDLTTQEPHLKEGGGGGGGGGGAGAGGID